MQIKELIKKNKYLLYIFLILISVFLIWSWVFLKFDYESWKYPVNYSGDTGSIFAQVKAYSDGEIYPVIPKFVSRLNAPFIANWNNFPIQEDMIYFVTGIFARLFGFFEACNLILLLAFILNCLSFWYVGKKLKFNASIMFSLSILFAFQFYAIFRSFPHIMLTFYFNVPMFLLVINWLFTKNLEENFKQNRLFIVSTCIFTGFLNPYYMWIFLTFIILAFLSGLLRKNKILIKVSLLLFFITFFSSFLMNADVFIYGLIHGKISLERNLSGLIVYGLKIPELIAPYEYHRSTLLGKFGAKFIWQDILLTEKTAPYLGLTGIISLLWLSIYSLIIILKKDFTRLPVYFWELVWIILYSVVGGVNLLFGHLFDFKFFRATNRYSIVISGIVLLFLAENLSKIKLKFTIIPLTLILIFVGLWDQIPRTKTRDFFYIPDKELIRSDRNFTYHLESNLPKAAMVFQLPVMFYPESASINKMSDYEHFRPYIYSNHLRFSYGTNQGRGDERWQLETEKLPVGEMVKKLELYGFDCLYINRKGYLDSANAMVDSLIQLNKRIIIDSKKSQLIAFRLEPSKNPVLPKN